MEGAWKAARGLPKKTVKFTARNVHRARNALLMQNNDNCLLQSAGWLVNANRLLGALMIAAGFGVARIEVDDSLSQLFRSDSTARAGSYRSSRRVNRSRAMGTRWSETITGLFKVDDDKLWTRNKVTENSLFKQS